MRGLFVSLLLGLSIAVPAEARHLAALGAVELRDPPTAPDLVLPMVAGGTADLKDFRGRLVLLTFWATWCLPCVEELPALERLQREFSRERFAILAVSIDAQGARIVEPFWSKAGTSFPALLDPRQAAATRYAAWALPTAFLIDPAGKVVARIQGPRRWDSEAILATFRDLLR